MKKIQDYVDKICEELEGAKEYAECYLDLKAHDKTNWASRFKEMSLNELDHAYNIHEYASEEIAALRKVYTPPAEMQEKWDIEHKKYLEKTAWIKTMLSM